MAHDYEFDADMKSVARRLAGSGQRLSAPGTEWDGMIVQPLVLSPQDMSVVLETLAHPPAPNENLRRLLRGEKPLPVKKHAYRQETGCGIGFCEVCHSDDRNDGNHFVEEMND